MRYPYQAIIFSLPKDFVIPDEVAEDADQGIFTEKCSKFSKFDATCTPKLHISANKPPAVELMFQVREQLANHDFINAIITMKTIAGAAKDGVIFDEFVLPIRASETSINTTDAKYINSPSRKHYDNLYLRHLAQMEQVQAGLKVPTGIWKLTGTYAFMLQITFECKKSYNPRVLEIQKKVMSEQNKNKSYAKQVYDFQESLEYADLTIVAIGKNEARSFRVHKGKLCLESTKFKKWIDGGGSAGVVNVKYEPESVNALIDWVYLKMFPLLQSSISVRLETYWLAVNFGLVQLAEFCLAVIKSEEPTADNAKELYIFAIENHFGDEIVKKWWEFYRDQVLQLKKKRGPMTVQELEICNAQLEMNEEPEEPEPKRPRMSRDA